MHSKETLGNSFTPCRYNYNERLVFLSNVFYNVASLRGFAKELLKRRRRVVKRIFSDKKTSSKVFYA